MPAYDFRCKDCRHTFTLSYESYQAFEEATPTCPQCGSTRLESGESPDSIERSMPDLGGGDDTLLD
jgi:putative FmdB family regulatory protein